MHQSALVVLVVAHAQAISTCLIKVIPDRINCKYTEPLNHWTTENSFLLIFEVLGGISSQFSELDDL